MPHDFETLAVHAGIDPEPVSGAVMTPIFQTSTYAQSSPGEHKGYEYARTDNPTRTILQTQLAALEGAKSALVYSSGMAAIDAVINLLSAGDHVLAVDDIYGGTRRYFTRLAAQRGIEFTFSDMRDGAAIEGSIRGTTKLIWCESPTNPTLKLVDLRLVSEIGRRHGILTVVDNTFMSPYFQRPIELGIDISMHSMTKYLNGHSDVVMGALMFGDYSGRLEIAEGMSLYERLKFIQNSVGAVPGPFDCWLVLRGLKTLAIRMQRIGENALAIANWLERHWKVRMVSYPGLASHPQHELAKSQTSGNGGVVTFWIEGGIESAKSFLSKLRIFTLAESLGGVESLAEHPAIMTHASVPSDVREGLGISDELIRLSIGIESAKDLIHDLDQALS